MSTPDPAAPPAPEDLRGLARGMRLLVELGAQTLTQDAAPSELALRVSAHLGCELPAAVQATERFPVWENVNVQRGVDAYLAARNSEPDWFGGAGFARRPHEDMLSMISMPASPGMARVVAPGGRWAGPGGASRTGAASYGTAPAGPDENTEVVTFGLVASTAPGGDPVVIGIRDESRFGPPFCNLEVLAADQAAATAARDEIERLMRAHDVFRGQVLSFAASEHHGNEFVTFLPRPAIAAQDVVLPEGVLENIERHIVGIAEWSQDLLAAGQHLKRGLLLHGPPGTGKTHTIRYLTGRLRTSTIILLTGGSIRFIDQAAALARRLQLSMVVLKDVRPDARCRRELLQVYARDLAVEADLDEVAAGSEGVTASFIKELIRRAVLVSLRAGERPPVLRGAGFAEVLAEMDSEHHALTRALLGADAGDGEATDMQRERKVRLCRLPPAGTGHRSAPTTWAACCARSACTRPATTSPRAGSRPLSCGRPRMRRSSRRWGCRRK